MHDEARRGVDEWDSGMESGSNPGLQHFEDAAMAEMLVSAAYRSICQYVWAPRS
jgi:hypothetical protein